MYGFSLYVVFIDEKTVILKVVQTCDLMKKIRTNSFSIQAFKN